MIVRFRNKALKRYWQNKDVSGIKPEWRKRTTVILSLLDVVATPDGMNVPGFGFHALTGDMAGRYAVTVSRNWRITFGFIAPDATDVDLEDYHG